MDLPKPIEGDPVAYLLNLVTLFSKDISGYVEGERNAEKLIRENKKAYKDFMVSIKSTAPDFRPYVSANEDVSAGYKGFLDAQFSNGSEFTHPIYLPEMHERIQKWVEHFVAQSYIHNYLPTFPL